MSSSLHLASIYTSVCYYCYHNRISGNAAPGIPTARVLSLNKGHFVTIGYWTFSRLQSDFTTYNFNGYYCICNCPLVFALNLISIFALFPHIKGGLFVIGLNLVQVAWQDRLGSGNFSKCCHQEVMNSNLSCCHTTSRLQETTYRPHLLIEYMALPLVERP